jgi:hypothetical protein
VACSFISVLLLNRIALLSNMSAISHLRRLARHSGTSGLPRAELQIPRVPAGWYRYHSGAPGQRY